MAANDDQVLVELTIRASELISKDLGSASDPYLVIHKGKKRLHKTEHIMDNASPEWKPFTINLGKCGGWDRRLCFEVYDFNHESFDRFIGRFHATLGELKEKKKFDFKRRLRPHKVTGHLELVNHSESFEKVSPVAHSGAVDILIIGGGFSGCWFADKLRSSHPDRSIRLLEKSDRIGGRLKSDDNDQDPDAVVKDELGGMRQFPSVMPKIKALIDRFDLTLIPLGLGDSQNLYHYEGKTVTKNDAALPEGGKYAGQAPGAISKEAVEKYKETAFWADCGGHAYACPELRNLSIREFLTKYAGADDKEIDAWFVYSGYNLYHDDVQASIYIADGELYGSSIKYHHFVKEGYMDVVTNLLDASGVVPEMQTTLLSVKKEGDSIIATTDKGETITAGKIVFGLSARELEGIEGVTDIISAERTAALSGCKYIPLFKCFLDFENPWWLPTYPYGKTTTDLDERQIHYYDKDDLLIYVSDGDQEKTKYATRWGDSFKNEGRQATLTRMWEETKMVHLQAGVPEESMCDPNWDECVWAYWPDGSHKWKKGCNVEKSIDDLTNGKADGSNVYFVGDAYSDMQGWVEGALNTCDKAFATLSADL